MNLKFIRNTFLTISFFLIVQLSVSPVLAGGNTDNFRINNVTVGNCTSTSCSLITTVIIDGTNFPSDAKAEAISIFDGHTYNDTTFNSNGFPYAVISGKTGSSQIIVDFNGLPCDQRYAVSVYSPSSKEEHYYAGNLFVTTNSCVVNQVYIESIFPSIPRQGDIVTIRGSGFAKNPSYNTVYVGDVPMPTQFNTLSADGKRLTFVLTTETPFRINQKYLVQVKTQNGPLLSNPLYMQISSPTSLSSIIPSVAVAGKTVTLVGYRFGMLKGHISFYDLDYKPVSFINAADIQSWNDNTIKIVVPDLAANKEYLVVVDGSFGGSFIYSSNPVKIKIISRAKITSITPSGSPNQIINITGQNFGNTIGLVRFSQGQNPVGAKINYWSDSEIKVIIPNFLAPGQTYNVSVMPAATIWVSDSFSYKLGASTSFRNVQYIFQSPYWVQK